MRAFWIVPLLLVSAAAHAADTQPPAGRWDGTIRFGTLKVPFRIDFETGGTKAYLVNGDARVESASGSFEGGKLHLAFAATGASLDGTLAEGELKGTVNSPRYGSQPFTAGAFCTCGFEGEGGPDIAGVWEAADAGWRLEVERKDEDTFATLTRPDSKIGPLSGRFDGAVFTLRYFDGNEAALLELEPAKAGDALAMVWMAPGAEPKKLRAARKR